MDSTSLKQPEPPYGMLPSLFIILIFLVIYYFIKFRRWYKRWRKRSAYHKLSQQYDSYALTYRQFSWQQWCKKIKKALNQFKNTGNIFYLYKAIVLCISCKAGNFLLNKSPLLQNMPLVTKDAQIALESLYISLYSRHPLAKIYLEKLLNLIKQLKCA